MVINSALCNTTHQCTSATFIKYNKHQFWKAFSASWIVEKKKKFSCSLNTTEIFENLYSLPSDSCVRLQQSLEEGGRIETESTVLDTARLISLFDCKPNWKMEKNETKLKASRAKKNCRNQITLNKFIFITSPLGLHLLGHICVRTISYSIMSAMWLMTYWNNPVRGGRKWDQIQLDSTFSKHNGLGNEARK